MILDISVIHANAQFLLTLVETIQTSSERLNIYACYRGDIARNDWMKLKQRNFKLYKRGNSQTMRCIKQWNKIARYIMEASPLGPFETRADKTAKNMRQRNWGELDRLSCSFYVNFLFFWDLIYETQTAQGHLQVGIHHSTWSTWYCFRTRRWSLMVSLCRGSWEHFLCSVFMRGLK